MNSKTDLAVLAAFIRQQCSAYMDVPRFESLSAYHGIQPLLYHCLHQQADWQTWPSELCESLTAAARYHHARTLLRQQELRQVLQQFAQQDIQAILMKGVALGYSHYQNPALRPCGDIDLLIRERDRATVDTILRTLGYQRPLFKAQLISYQDSYGRLGRLNMRHELDVHWKISNRPLFAKAFDYAEALAHAVPLPQLDDAPALCPIHALLLACVHRAAHLQDEHSDRSNPDRLIWFYDMHLLVQAMTVTELSAFIQIAQQKQLSAACADALHWTRHYFQTEGISELLAKLHGGQSELSNQYINAGSAQALWLDWRALPDSKSRFKALQNAFLPAPAYMLKRYSKTSCLWLPLLYPYRWLKALWRFTKS